MPATVRSATVVGLDVIPVDVEVEVLPGLPSVTIVGLPDTAVKEARERITAALSNAGFVPPRHRTIVNLAPAHIRKEGPLFDLPIAIGFLVASGQCVAPLQAYCFAGSLGLDGSLRPVVGTVALAEHAAASGAAFVVPPANVAEAALAGGTVIAPAHLRELVDGLEGRTELPRALAPSPDLSPPDVPVSDFTDIAGQEHAKRALEIAAAGGHNVLLHGPPGSGKTLLARAFPGILPPLSDPEAFEVTKIYSVRGLLSAHGGLIRARPFRAPHHSTSAVALTGGGSVPQPGEVTLAHRGVLFLDEFAEFPRHVLDHLRQPLEDGEVWVSRAAGSVRFPARFTLIAAMNPCSCGFAGDAQRVCTCTAGAVASYQRRVSGPLLDRIDLHVSVPALPATVVLDRAAAEPSEHIRARVTEARAIQTERFHASRINAEMGSDDLRAHGVSSPEGRALLLRAADTLHLSARALHRTLKVARTIADLAGRTHVQPDHLAEALQYRTPLLQE